MTAEEIRAFGLEYAAVLKHVIDGSAAIKVVGETWNEVYVGNVEFEADGWRFAIFNDCDCIDYTDWVIAPDGRRADFDDLFDNCADPICYTLAAEVGGRIDIDALEQALEMVRL